MPKPKLTRVVPLQQPPAEPFSDFDDNSTNLIGNLRLDADEEPRRVGATSRANSVRFDETANHGHWAHTSRSSLDLIPRTGSSMGGHLMSERSFSYKSDGRQSSTGHSVHSATSGRANSFTGFGLTPPADPPALPPGLFILGTVPAIIRCWLNTNFKHNTLLYAAVCTGSYTSYLDHHLLEPLGVGDQIFVDEDGTRKIKLPLYLPEAVPVSPSSRSSSPAPQLPSLSVDFTIVDEHDATADPKTIKIFLGSDVLRAHSADVLFSSNQLTLYDDDRTKLQIPLVRPEDERAFKFLSTNAVNHSLNNLKKRTDLSEMDSVKGSFSGKTSVPMTNQSQQSYTDSNEVGTAASSEDGASSGRRSFEQRQGVGMTTSDQVNGKDREPHRAAVDSRTAPSPAMWNNWRREQNEKVSTGPLDWANVGKTTVTNTNYQRRDTGIKVLKPSRPVRTLSTSNSSPATGQSRFFDDGKRREEDENESAATISSDKRTVSSEKPKENSSIGTKPRLSNPVGGASAFSWLHGGGTK